MIIRKTFAIETKAIDEEAGIFEIMISTEEQDRQDDIVRATGAKLDNYLRNPVVLYGHDYSDFPIARSLSLEIMPGRGIKSTFQFPAWGTYEKADIARKLYAAKFLNAASIGFQPITAIPLNEDRYWGPQDYVEWELYEWSLVTVPANQSALRLSLGRSPVQNASGLINQIMAVDEYLEKRGRVLSASNEAKLRQAADNITAVLAQLESDDTQEESLEEMARKDQPEGTVTVKRLCSKCTKRIEMSATLALELKQSGKEPLCQDCLIKSDPGMGEGTPAPVTEPVEPAPDNDPTSNDLDEAHQIDAAVLASLTNLFETMTGAQ